VPALTGGSPGESGPTSVCYWDGRAFFARHREEILAVVDRVLASGRLILSAEVLRFERDFAAFCGVPWGVGVNSGTDALFLALKAIGVGPGDEVLTVANTAVPTVAAIRAAGATPVFVDVEEETYLMDLGQVSARLTPRLKAAVPVHLAGLAVDMPGLLQILRPRGIAVVEDCAQACGAACGGRRVGGFGDAGAFSFYPTKVLGAFGDAGMVVTSDEALSRRLRRLRFYGMDQEYVAEEEGYNSRLDELQAALLSLRLAHLDEAVAARRSVARRYDEALAGLGDLRLPAARAGRDHHYYLYTVRTDRRDELRRFLSSQGIETKINYPVPVHLMPAYRFLGYRAGDLPVTERLAATILSLPIYPEMPPGHVERVTEAVREFFLPGQRGTGS
jgi:dTDP-3-amino-2,3,6-trideoxy-4-keto-D-glucose/dTDP-3-amino-3,4,6-trideoxy-alpha-D-glucose/dTDP-2,6-dideoxy-D-kanosamine transaminase